MRKCYILLTALLCSYSMNAHVGINTDNPRATLDAQKGTDLTKPIGIIPPRVTGDELRNNASLYGSAQNGAIVYVTAPVTATNEPKTSGVTTRGLFVYDAVEPNGVGSGSWQILPDGPASGTSGSGAFAAKFRGNIGLLSLSLANLFSTSFNYIPLSSTNSTATIEIPSSQVVNNEYVVPSDGLYHVNFSFRNGQGLSAQLLSANPPGIAITKREGVATSSTLLDYREFGGVNLLDLTLPFPLNGVTLGVNNTLTQGQISHIYNLKANDKLRFGLVQGGLNVSVLNDNSAELSIYKIN